MYPSSLHEAPAELILVPGCQRRSYSLPDLWDSNFSQQLNCWECYSGTTHPTTSAMYEPPNPRPKKTNITRSRLGCAPCRRKRRKVSASHIPRSIVLTVAKCDEQKPSCRRCVKASSPCHYEEAVIGFRDVSTWLAKRAEHDKAASDASSSGQRALHVVNLQSPPQEMPVYEAGTQEALFSSQQTLDNDPFLSGSQSPHVSLSFESGPETPAHAASLPAVPLLDEEVPDRSRSSEPSEDMAWLEDVPAAGITRRSISGPAGPCADFGMEAANLPSLDDTWAVDDLCMASMGDGRSWSAWSAACTLGYPTLSVDDRAGRHYLPESPFDMSPSTNPPEVVEPRLPSLHDGFGCLGATPRSTQQSKPSSTLVRLADRRYMAYFTLEVMNNLPAQVDELWQWVMDLAPLRLAAMALAAASLANKQGILAPGRRGRWVPLARHAREAAQYMDRCLEALHGQRALPLFPAIAFWVLKVCYELETGSIQGTRRALAVVDDVLSNNKEEVLSLPAGKALARNCLLLRCFEGLAKKPHAPLGRESRGDALMSVFQPHIATPELLISMIGCRGCRLSWRILLVRCLRSCSESSAETIRKMTQWWEVIMGGWTSSDALESDHTSDPVLDEEELYAELKTFRAVLRTCQAPEGMPSNAEECEKTQALRFKNHRYAMACADYCLAQLACNEDFTRHLTAEKSAASSSEAAFDPTPMSDSPWLRLLLRIAYGLDPRECQRYNVYRAGIVTMLQYVVFLGAGRDAVTCMDDFYRRAASAGVQYEGPFSPLQACWMLDRVVCRETTSHPGRAIFVAAPTIDPSSTEQLYSKVVMEYMLICGREADGTYFNDIVPLTEDDDD